MQLTTRLCLAALLLAVIAACSGPDTRGIADKRSDFRKFIPMKANPTDDGLKMVKPYFRHPDPAEIMRAINRACVGGKTGSSVYDPTRQAGYYVNCNPTNRQLLNGYIPLNSAVQPRSH